MKRNREKERRGEGGGRKDQVILPIHILPLVTLSHSTDQLLFDQTISQLATNIILLAYPLCNDNNKLTHFNSYISFRAFSLP